MSAGLTHPDALTPPLDSELKTLLRRLKLGKAVDTLPDRLTLARTNKLSHAEFLTLEARLIMATVTSRRATRSRGHDG